MEIEKTAVTDLERLQDAHVLLIGEHLLSVRVLGRLLDQAGYAQVTVTTDCSLAVDMFLRTAPDLVVLDLETLKEGIQLIDELTPHIAPGVYLPIVVLSDDQLLEERRRALAAGAMEVITKPFDGLELLLRIANLLKVRNNQGALRAENFKLNRELLLRTGDLENAQRELIERLGIAAELYDRTAGDHVRSVGRLSELIALRLGLSELEAKNIGLAAPLHDIGKFSIAREILMKTAPLEEEEWAAIRGHPTWGAAILAGSKFPILALAEEIARTHHERWDGGGYPDGSSGANIPLSGRIVAVADTFDALTRNRPYKNGWTREAAIAEVRDQSGRQFDPAVVDAFLEVVSDDSEHPPQQEQERKRTAL